MKFCIDCKHASSSGCRHHAAGPWHNRVNGETYYVSMESMRDGFCGEEAKLHEELPWIFKILRRIYRQI